jgi:RNA polymerase sigma factor, sigma-70 family
MSASDTVTMSSDTERRALLRAYREDGDLAARDRLVAELMPFARSLARRYAGKGEELEDLVQVAAVGLVKAIDKFDLERDVRMVAYIFPTVVGELKRHFRDRAWAVSVPRRLKELNQLLSRHLEELTRTLGRSPTIAELAQASGLEEEEVLEALEAGRAYTARSLSGGFG